MNKFGQKMIGATCLAALMLPTSALALDARNFADQLTQTLSALGSITINFADAKVEGDNIVLSGITLDDVPGKDGESKLLETSVTFTNVIETANGGHQADQALFENLDIDKDGVHLVVSDMSIDSIELFADSNMMQLMHFYEAINIGPLTVALEGEDVFSIDSMNVTVEINDDDTIVTSDYLVSGIFGDISKIDDEEAIEIFGMLGLEAINATMEGHSTWNVQEGKLSMLQNSISVEDIGRLNIGMDLFGYTLEIAEKIQALSKTFAEADEDEAEMLGMQMLMSMAADLSFGSLNIRFDDDSLTNNVMDFIGQEEGISRKGMISTVAQLMPAVLGQLDIGELEADITDAVIAYLRNPQSIEVDASPEEPVPFMALMAVAQNPSIAKDMLNLSITANQPE